MQSVSLFSLPTSESPPLIGPRSSDSIIEAIVAGDVTMAMDLVKHSDPECLDWSPTHTCTPLHQAALYGNADLVEAILDAMPSEAVDLQDGGGRTALHWALELNHRACAHAILPRTSSDALSLLDGYNRTPLHLAARTGDLASVEGILERMHPKDITARDRSGNAAIEHAIRCGNRKCARAISRVLDISQAPPWAWQEAIATAIRSNDRKMLCYLLDAKGPNGSLDGMLLLRSATFTKQAEIVEDILQRLFRQEPGDYTRALIDTLDNVRHTDAEPCGIAIARKMEPKDFQNDRDRHRSAFSDAIRNKNQDLAFYMAQRLLSDGFNVASPLGCELLISAIDYGHPRTASLMLKHFPQSENTNYTRSLAHALYCAALTGWADGVDQLIDRVPVEVLQQRFASAQYVGHEELAVHAAVRSGHIDIALTILHRLGLERYRQITENADTVLHIAGRSHPLKSFTRLLEAFEASDLARPNENRSLPLHEAAMRNSRDLIELIADAMEPQDLALKNSDNLSALEISLQQSPRYFSDCIALALVQRMRPEDLLTCATNGTSLLVFAVRHGWWDVVETLRARLNPNDFTTEAEAAIAEVQRELDKLAHTTGDAEEIAKQIEIGREWLELLAPATRTKAVED